MLTRSRIPPALLAWMVLAAIWMSWAPFEFRGTWPPLQLQLVPEPQTVGHFFLLMPFAALGVACLRGPDGRWNWRVAAAVAALGLILELGQLWIEGRSISPHDVLVGYLGAALAMGLTERLLRHGISPESLSRVVAAATILLVWGVMVHGAVNQNYGLRLAAWTGAFPVLAGEEAGGSRAYIGTVEQPRICAGEALDDCVAPGADLQSRTRLAGTAMDSQRLRLTARVTSETDDQEGPARIVTFSDGPYLRNVTLAQRKRNLILRLRTLRGGPNGTSMEFVLDDSMSRHEPTQLTATFDGGAVTMRAEAGGRVNEGTYRPPFRNSLRAQGLARPRLLEPLMGRASLVGTVVQFLGLGLALGYGIRLRASRVILAPVLALAFLWTLDGALNRMLNPTGADYALAAIAAMAAAIPRQGRLLQSPDSSTEPIG